MQLSDAMQQYWTNFVKNGDPNGPGLPQWSRYSVEQRRYIEFSAEGPVPKANLRRPFCEIFQQSFKRKLPD